jgi:Putative restriction endonuclease
MVSGHAAAQAKLPGYAAAGVLLAWLIDVPARAVHLCTDPRGREYGAERVLRAGDVLDPPLPGIAPIDELFAVLDR